MQCPNCNQQTIFLGKICGCTWSEMIRAARSKEREARKAGEKKVIVDEILKPIGKL